MGLVGTARHDRESHWRRVVQQADPAPCVNLFISCLSVGNALECIVLHLNARR